MFFSIVRVYWPIFAIQLRTWLLQFKLAFASRKERTHALIARGENLSPVGANPFEFSAVYRRWASTSFKSIKPFPCGLMRFDAFSRYRRYRHVRDAPQQLKLRQGTSILLLPSTNQPVLQVGIRFSACTRACQGFPCLGSQRRTDGPWR